MFSRIAALSTRRTLASTAAIYTIRTAVTDTAAVATSATCVIKSGATSSSSSSPSPPLKIVEGPERDLVNFPRRPRPLYPGAVRLTFIPVEWFDFFYRKTGVTGPYLWLTGLTTLLVSKEFYVLEHEYYTGISIAVFTFGVYKLFGPQVADYLDKGLDEEENQLQQFRDGSVASINNTIMAEQEAQYQAAGQKILFAAKRENIHLQLEAEYRQRLMHVYNEVKKRLDYQVELQNAARRIEQQHMIKWIVDNVLKSITPQQEKDALQQCIGNLKSLAAKAV